MKNGVFFFVTSLVFEIVKLKGDEWPCDKWLQSGDKLQKQEYLQTYWGIVTETWQEQWTLGSNVHCDVAMATV